MARSRDSSLPKPLLAAMVGVLFLGVTVSVAVALSSAGSDLLLAAVNLVLIAVLVVTTMFYAYQTWALVVEAEATRVAELQAREQAGRRAKTLQIEGAAQALVGAVNDLVGAGTVLSTLIRHRRVFRVMNNINPSLAAITSASKALDRLRYVAPGEVLEAGDRLFASLLAFFELTLSGPDRADLEEGAAALAKGKDALNIAVRGAVEQLMPPAN